MAGPFVIPIFPALAATGLISGFIDAVAGGGGLIMMPALITAGLPAALALGTNKLQSSCGTATACWRYRRAGLVDAGAHSAAVAAVFAGAAAGALVISRLNAHLLSLLVPLLLAVVAFYTLLSPRMTDADARPRLGQRSFLPVGTALGFYDGFFGPGAGQFYVASLVALRGLGLTRATAVTKLLNLASNLASLCVFALAGKVWWQLGLTIALGSMTGAWAGSHVATRHGAQVIRPVLVAVSLALTARLVWQWFAR